MNDYIDHRCRINLIQLSSKFLVTGKRQHRRQNEPERETNSVFTMTVTKQFACHNEAVHKQPLRGKDPDILSGAVTSGTDKLSYIAADKWYYPTVCILSLPKALVLEQSRRASRRPIRPGPTTKVV